MLLEPRRRLSNLSDLTVDWIREQGCNAVVLDADYTLCAYGSPHPDPGVREWLEVLKTSGIPVAIASNNTKRRLMPLAETLHIPYVSGSMKPFSRGLKKACQILGYAPSEVLMVGDQLFTDVLGGNRLGMVTVLLDPVIGEDNPIARLRYRIEQIVLRRMERRKR